MDIKDLKNTLMININNYTIDFDFFENIRKLCYDLDSKLYKDLLDSFSPSQFKSKVELIAKLNNQNIVNTNSNIAVLGCWYNSIFGSLLHNKVNSIVGYDIDSTALNIGKKLFKGIKNIEFNKADIFKFGKYKHTLQNIDIIINTSCEHMLPMKNWNYWNRTHKNTIFAFQSNNMDHIDDHTNCVYSIDEFINQMPTQFKTISTSETHLDNGIRYTLIGKYEKNNL